MMRELRQKKEYLEEAKVRADAGRVAILKYEEYLEKVTDFQDLADMSNLSPEGMISYIHEELNNKSAQEVRSEAVNTLLRAIEFKYSDTKCVCDLIRVVLDKT